MSYPHGNIFDKILKGEIPATPLLENDYVFAFKDINPKAPVHILVIPKGRYTDIHDFGLHAKPEEKAAMFEAVAALADEAGVANKGYRVIANTKVHGGQEVPHFHFHILGGTQLGAMIGS
ncbi:MAG: HIT domain-containing protein [Pseudobdellovibrionaceae bacterium]